MRIKWSRCVLAVVMAASLAPVCTTMAGVVKATGKNAAALRPAVAVFPGTVYDNAYQVPGAKGKVNMIQPKGNVDLILAVSVEGLSPNSRYTTHFDTTGIVPGDISTAGRWTRISEFWTDAYGRGKWNYTVPAGTYAPGSYIYSVFINRTEPKWTVLISENVQFEIAGNG